MQTVAEAGLAQMLADLGDTPDKVADTLAAENIKGQPCNGLLDPVALYVSTKTGEVAWVTATTVEVEEDDYSYQVTMPEPVRIFSERFDRGHYPQLKGETEK